MKAEYLAQLHQDWKLVKLQLRREVQGQKLWPGILERKCPHTKESYVRTFHCESLIQAGVGAGIGAVFSAKDIYEVRALRTRTKYGPYCMEYCMEV